MIQIIILFAGSVLTAVFYLYINVPSLENKSREFNRVIDILVLEQQIEEMVEAGREDSTDGEELEAIGKNLIALYRVEVTDQFKRPLKIIYF